jgi:imidazolonepropionase-like amidohydrolase
MVQLGICTDNEHALRTITSLSARMNDLQDDRGRLAEGLAGDVIVVDGNPLEQIDAIEAVEAVFLDGVQVV